MNTEFGRKAWGTSNCKNALPSGTRFQNGKYILLEVYGQGPFTICYLARQTVLGKKVVINEFFLTEHCSRSADGEVINEKINEKIYRTFRDNWFEEAMLLSKCSGNEHFVTILDTFEENGTAYYVSEYINEEDLRTFTLAQKSKYLNESQAINFITQIIKGLSFLHENNIFHLNLSPIKVLLDKSNRAVIFSVGIARKKIPSEILSDLIKLARPGYTSPELYQKESDGGVFADIYSVGAILYFLLTGKDPVPATERFNNPLIEPKSINPSITSQTNSAVMKALAMNPEDRYPNLNEFLKALADDSKKPGPTKTKKLVFYSALVLVLMAIITFIGIVKFRHDKPINQISEQINLNKNNHRDKLTRLSLYEDKTRGMTMVKDADSKESTALGKYYALLIGIENYKDTRYQKLSEPVNDVKSMYDVLINNYTFEKKDVQILTNPGKREIFSVLNSYRDSLSQNDNLFVFYAGHGCYDKKAKMGYLIPSDADSKNDADWISFQDIRKKFEVIAANHILLVADACYAGSVFRGDDSNAEEEIKQITLEQFSKKSRTAFTSSDLKPVPDRSDFLKHLISTLKNNKAQFFLSEDLYIATRSSLIRSTSKKDPVKWGVLQDCGDEGGDFVFIRRPN